MEVDAPGVDGRREGPARGASTRVARVAAAGAARWPVLLGVALALTGCTETPTGVEGQRIEEVEFAAELGIDLAEFTKLANGVYVRDEVVGEGDLAETVSVYLFYAVMFCQTLVEE